MKARVDFYADTIVPKKAFTSLVRQDAVGDSSSLKLTCDRLRPSDVTVPFGCRD